MQRRKGEGEIVAIIGLDGSGKTTLARGLVRRLRAQGRRAAYVHLWPTLPSLCPLGRLGLRGTPRAKPRSPTPTGAAVRDPEPPRLPLWRAAALLLLMLYVLRVRLPWLLRRYELVVCDRFVPDVAAYLQLRGRPGAAGWLLRVGLGAPLRPRAIFRLRVPLEELARRKGEVLEHPLNVYGRWDGLYDELIARVPQWAAKTHALDGSRPPDELLEEVERRLRLGTREGPLR